MVMIAKSEGSALLIGKPTVGQDPQSVYPSPSLSFTCNLILSPPVPHLIFQVEIEVKNWLLVQEFHRPS
jgi:hypothetical protein